MKLNLFYKTLSIIILLASCGPSETEKAEQQKLQLAREDSIRLAVEMDTKNKLEAKQALQDSLENCSNSLELLQSELIEEKANLELAKDQLVRIKEFQFGRTSTDRDSQIKNQSMIILGHEEKIKELEKQISELKIAIEKLKGKLLQ